MRHILVVCLVSSALIFGSVPQAHAVWWFAVPPLAKWAAVALGLSKAGTGAAAKAGAAGTAAKVGAGAAAGTAAGHAVATHGGHAASHAANHAANHAAGVGTTTTLAGGATVQQIAGAAGATFLISNFADVAEGIAATLDVMRGLGYIDPPSDVVNKEDIEKDIGSSIKAESPYKVRYCLNKQGKRMAVSKDIEFCPYDGRAPMEEHSVQFDSESGKG